jgi:peptidoglycan/LPS O-acetylase OafA/YrhL
MKSSSGAHFVGLDHIRALAAFLVFSHHVMMAALEGGAVLPDRLSFFGNSMIAQGHTGVALFMTLSGYLFARLCSGRNIDGMAFLINRALRLAPLLLIVIAIQATPTLIERPDSIGLLLLDVAGGMIYPTWPSGGWSIAVELHFYILLPVLLTIARRNAWALLGVLLAAILVRSVIFAVAPEQIHLVAYRTIFGRIDQFVLGMVMANAGAMMAKRHAAAAFTALSLMLAVYAFDVAGGVQNGSLHLIWVIWPTVEAVAYAILIAWYDRSFTFSNVGLPSAIAKIGQWSFSIYLLHFFFVWPAIAWLQTHYGQAQNFSTIAFWAVAGFGLMLIPAALSFRYIESPFLRFRRSYFRSEAPEKAAADSIIPKIA